MLNAGIIGLGVGRKHAEAIELHPRARVAALCDLDQTKLDEVGQSFAEAGRTTRAEDILDDPDIGLVCIAGYDDTHCEQVVRAIENGKHVFVEKPICLHERELREIRAALNAHPKVRLSSNLNLRACPRFLRLRSMLQNGDMGEVFSFEADYLWGRVFKLTEGWRGKLDFYSIIHGAGVHMVDLILWTTGRRPVRVQGAGNRIATRGSRMQHNDFATLLLTFEDGMVAKVSSVSGSVHPHFHRVSVYGTKKTFVHEHTGARVYDSADPANAPEEITDEYPGVPEKKQIIHTFVDALCDTDLAPAAEPMVTEADVFDAMSVCLAGERAVREQTIIDIEYL